MGLAFGNFFGLNFSTAPHSNHDENHRISYIYHSYHNGSGPEVRKRLLPVLGGFRDNKLKLAPQADSMLSNMNWKVSDQYHFRQSILNL